MDTNKRHAGKGWNRSLRTWLALAATAEERAVYRELLKQPDVGEYPMHLDIAPMERGVDGRGKWWGNKEKSNG